MLLAGIVLGGFIGMLAQDIPGLGWLSYGQTFGLQQPVILDLGILVLTLGLSVNISIASIVGMIFLSLFIASYNLLNRSLEFTKDMNQTMKELLEEERPYEKCGRFGAKA